MSIVSTWSFAELFIGNFHSLSRVLTADLQAHQYDKDDVWRKRITDQIERHRMLRFGRRIGVAVSGGADSVFLLRALAELELATVILHVNHKLRGADSDADEAFVRR